MSCHKNQINLRDSSSVNLQRLCEILDHEISTHYVREKNSQKFQLPKSADYNETEEGMALINEELASSLGTDIVIEPTIHHISTYIAEQKNFEETYKLLTIWYKLVGNKNPEKSAKDRTQRVKRFYSNDYPGANRKDTSYRRGSFDVFNFLKSSTPENLKKMIQEIYVGKISPEDIETVQEIIKNNSPEETPIIPTMIGKIIYAKLLAKGGDISIKSIQEQDPRFNTQVARADYETKRKIIQILQFLESASTSSLS